MSEFILHHYWPSPFAHKIRLAFGLAEVEWSSVEIPRILPKPYLMPLTAGYRRTPILQIGSDIYCDTQNIIRILAEKGLASALFPNGCKSKALVFSSWIDETVFELAARIVITKSIDSAPKEFIKDRGDLYFEKGWSQESLLTKLPSVILQLESKLQIIDDILAEEGNVFSNKLSYADISVGYLLWFLRGRWEDGPNILNKYDNILRLENQINQLNEKLSKNLRDIDALKIAYQSSPESPNGVHNNLVTQLKIGQNICIKPKGDSSDPIVTGKLRFVDSLTVSIDYNSSEAGHTAVHFPISGYEVLAKN